MKVYLNNEKKPICIEIFIHSLKYINIFSNFVHEVRQEISICFTVRCEPNKFENHCSTLTFYSGLDERSWQCCEYVSNSSAACTSQPLDDTGTTEGRTLRDWWDKIVFPVFPLGPVVEGEGIKIGSTEQCSGSAGRNHSVTYWQDVLHTIIFQ
jgi:hypothetical protein